MKHKRFLLFFALVLAANTLRAQTLVLHHADGTTTDVDLFTTPRIHFQNDKVLITSTVLDMEYSKDDIFRFTYKGIATNIDKPTNNENFKQENDKLVFYGVKAADNIALYKQNGIRVPVRVQKNGSMITLPLSHLSQGIYILNVNGRTSKFTKR